MKSWNNSKIIKVYLFTSGCKDLLDDKLLNLKKTLPTSRETTITTFGMTSTLPIEMQIKTKNEQFPFINLCQRSTRDSQRLIRWKANQLLIFVFISPEDAAVRAQVVDIITEYPKSQIY